MRLDAALVAEMREFVRDQAGKPLYLNPSAFIEGAITAHLVTLKRRLEEGEKGAVDRDRNAQTHSLNKEMDYADHVP